MSIKTANCILYDGTGKRYIDDIKPMMNTGLDKLTGFSRRIVTE